LVASFLLPYLARHHSDATAIQSALTRARIGLIAVSLVAVWGLFLFVQPITSLLYPGMHANVDQILPVILTALLGYSLTHIYGTALTANGELRVFQWIIAFFLLLHVVLSYCWIPQMGALGSARAAIVSQIGTGLTLMYWVHRRSGIPQPIPTYIVVIFTGGLIWILN
jgi:O-antigen/teichoic acid export membrane protein